MTTSKAAWMLLVLCLMWGAGVSEARAEDGPGVQLLVVLDSSNPTGDSQMSNLVPQAASVLVHLLGDQDYLGLVGSGQPDGVLLPTAGLSPEHRKQALYTLASLPRCRTKSPSVTLCSRPWARSSLKGPSAECCFGWPAMGALG